MLFPQLEYFVEVAKYGSFNRAADHLFISQQSLRASIKSLEQKMGVSLFTRSSQGIQLTEQGKVVLRDAQRILEISDGWKRLSEPVCVDTETVEILASPLICSAVVPDIIKECHNFYPNLRIRLFSKLGDEMLPLMHNYSIGILGSAPENVITNTVCPFAEKADFDFEILGADRFCVFLNASNPLAGHPYLTTGDLSTLTLVAYPGTEGHFFYRDIHRYFSKTSPFFFESRENIFQMISENRDAAAIFPYLATFNNRYVSEGLITALPVRYYPMPAFSCIIFPKSDKLTTGQKVMIMMFQRRLNELSQQMSTDFIRF